jgi:hypothetical protein
MRTCSVADTIVRWKYHLDILNVVMRRMSLGIQEQVKIVLHFTGMSDASVNKCSEMAGF